MQKAKFESYAARKGWTLQPADDGWTMAACPLCGEGLMTIHLSTESFDCSVCGREDGDGAGSLLKLFRIMGDLHEMVRRAEPSKKSAERPPRTLVDTHHAMLKQDKVPGAKAWLAAQGFDEKFIDTYKIGAARVKETPCITIPIFDSDGVLNIRFEPVGGGQSSTMPKCADYSYSPSGLSESPMAVLVPSELDVLALHAMGVRGGVFVSDLSPKSRLLEDRMAACKEVALLAFDPTQSQEFAKRVGQHRTRIVPSDMSPRQTLAAGFSGAKLQEAIRTSKSIYEHRLARPEEYRTRLMERVMNKETIRGEPTGWKGLDELFGGWRGGEFTIVTGNTGSGKTTWVKGAVMKLVRRGQPVLMGSFENGPESVIEKCVMELADKEFQHMEDEDLDKALVQLDAMPIRFMDIHGEIEFDELVQLIHLGINRFGTFLVVLDNLQFMLNPKRAEDERIEVERVCKTLKAITRSTGVHIVLICHPHKLKENNPVVGANDLKGSGDLDKYIDNGITIWRRKSTDVGRHGPALAWMPDNVVLNYIWKARADCAQEGMVMLEFQKKSNSYTEANREELQRRYREAKKRAKTAQPQTDASNDSLDGIPPADDDDKKPEEKDLFPM